VVRPTVAVAAWYGSAVASANSDSANDGSRLISSNCRSRWARSLFRLTAGPSSNQSFHANRIGESQRRMRACQELRRANRQFLLIGLAIDTSTRFGPAALNRGNTEAKLPPGWEPEAVALWLPYTDIPAGVWAAPVPVVGLAADWNLQWHAYRALLSRCDLVLSDLPGVMALGQDGAGHVRPANLFGLDRAYLEEAPPESPRDIGWPPSRLFGLPKLRHPCRTLGPATENSGRWSGGGLELRTSEIHSALPWPDGSFGSREIDRRE